MDRQSLFTAAVSEVLKTADVRDGLAYEPHPDVALDELRSAMEQVSDELLAETANEERRYVSAAAAVADAVSSRAEDSLLRAPKRLATQASKGPGRLARRVFVWTYGIVLLAAVAAAGIYLFGHWWGAAASLGAPIVVLIAAGFVSNRKNGDLGLGAAVVFVVAYLLFLSGYVSYRLDQHLHANLLVTVLTLAGATALFFSWLAASNLFSAAQPPAPELSASSEASNASRQDAQRLAAEAQTALERWREALERQVLPRFVRQWFNKRREIGYGTRLDVRVWSGLWQPSEDFHVDTSAVRELAGILSRSAVRANDPASPEGGGSIGLYGPRGAGKTHLIRAFCGGSKRADSDLAVVVTAPVEYAPSEFVLHIDARICQAVLQRLGEKVTTPRGMPPSPWRRLALILGLSSATVSAPKELALASLARRVELHRQQLYHLMAISDEVSGNIGLKVVEAGVRSAVTLTQQPRTYPEIVDAFRELLLEVVRTLGIRVVIGIDDLDRIDSAERARAFLHEIKAIFGVPGCFYLVSISDEALTDFDQGGRFRGTFDSAFDELVRVDRLNLQASKGILAQRTAVMSEPFRFLCHCVAGGLARELVRIARMIADDDLARPAGSELLSLSAVTERVVSIEAQRLCTAVQSRFAPHEHLAQIASVMRGLDGAARESSTAKLLSELIGALLASLGDPADLIDVTRVTAARLYQLMTVLEVFTDQIEPERLREANRAGLGASLFDELAWARQQALVSPLLAWRAVDRVRSSFGLAVIPAAG